MGQNSSVQNCDRNNSKRLNRENTGSELTILQTIVQRRGSTTKIKRRIHQRKDNKDYVIDVRNKTKNDEKNESIAQLIRKSNNQDILKQQEKFLERVLVNKIESSIYNTAYHTSDQSRYPSTPINTKEETSKHSKSLKNWTIKDPNQHVSSNLNVKTVYVNKRRNKVENNGDANHKIHIKKNNQEKVNELFKTLQAIERKEDKERAYNSKKKQMNLLSISHQNGVTIPPEQNNILKNQKTSTKIYEKQIDESKYRIEQLTKQHLQKQNCINQSNNNSQNASIHESGFENLLSELRYKLSPTEQSKLNCNISHSISISKDDDSINSFNWSSKSFRTSNETLYIRDISEIQDRFQTYSVTESVESKIEDLNKPVERPGSHHEIKKIRNDQKNDSLEQHSKPKHNQLNNKMKTEIRNEQKNIDQKRYRSVNDNSKIYYYLRSQEQMKKEKDFFECPLPDVPLGSEHSDSRQLSIDRNNYDSKNRKFTWVQDKDKNWHKVIL